MRIGKSLFILLSITILATACGSATPKPSGSSTLKIAVLPIIDTLPMYVAQQEGLFSKAGVNVEFIAVASAPERDQLIASGQADGMINETLSTFFFNKDKTQVQIVRYALRPTEKAPHFFILASAKSGIATPDQLKGVEVGVSQGTIIEYVNYRLLEQNGLTADEIITIAVPKIPDRLALLGSGELSAAVLPDPSAALAIQQGANVVVDDAAYPQYGFSVISFRKVVIDQNPGAIRSFLDAIEQATQSINANPENYTSILSEQKLVPAPLLESYSVPPYPTAGIPTEAEWNDALIWAKEKGMLTVDVSYLSSVSAEFLPKQ